MTEPIRGAGQPSWPLSPYQIAVSYGIPGASGTASAAGAANATAAAGAGIARGGGADWFGPLDPLKPIAPPEVAGRRFDFPPGYNLITRPRAYEPIGFAELRGFADAYDLLRLVIETRKDQMERQRWCIRPRAPLPGLARARGPHPSLPRERGREGWGRGTRNALDADTGARIAALEKFWQKPDGVTRWKTWLRALLEDMFVIDAATLYCRRTRAGQLCALHQLDGATIKRVIDDWGRTPQPYAAPDGSTIYPPAYQQVLKGLPAVDYAVRDIIYRPRNVRAHRVYGYSPVQQVLMTVNIALRRQLWQLDYFSEGSIPDALIGVPAGWTPDQIRQFQDYWDTEFAGDLAKRRRAKFVPGDSAVRVHQTKEPEHKQDFDEWLARIICYAFSVPPQWAVKLMNRATADNQSAQAEDEGLEPTKEWVKDLVDEVIAEEFASPDLELLWLDEDSGAAQIEAQFEARVKIGAATLNELRDALGLDPFANPAADRPMVLTPTGYVPIEAGAGGAGNARASADAHGRTASGQTVGIIQKYNPDQPRVPAGSSQGGQWTSGGAGTASSDLTLTPNDTAEGTSDNGPTHVAPVNDSRVISDVTPDNTWEPGAQYAQINIQNNAKTNNPAIDNTTDILLQTLARVHALAGDGSGPWYGTRIHIMFANDVRLQNLPGIGWNGVEQSFSLGDIADYGEDGTVRVDVYMRDDTGKIIAIWDVKTGGAVLTGARVRELRAEAGVGSDVPVIELHVTRGATLKASGLGGVVFIIAAMLR